MTKKINMILFGVSTLLCSVSKNLTEDDEDFLINSRVEMFKKVKLKSVAEHIQPVKKKELR